MNKVFRLEAYKQSATRHGLVFLVLNSAAFVIIAATIPLLMKIGLPIQDWRSALLGGLAFFSHLAGFGAVLLVAVNLGQEFEQKTIVQQRLRSVLPGEYLSAKFVWISGITALSHLIVFLLPRLVLSPTELYGTHILSFFAVLLHSIWLVASTLLFVCLTRQSLAGFLASSGFFVIVDLGGANLLIWMGTAFGRPTLTSIGALFPWNAAQAVAHGASGAISFLLLLAYTGMALWCATLTLRRTEYARI